MKKLLAVVLGVSVLATAVAGCGSNTAWPETRVTVHSGDTVWAIAQQYTPEGGDIRCTEFYIKKWSGLNNTRPLQIGSTLIIKVDPRTGCIPKEYN